MNETRDEYLANRVKVTHIEQKMQIKKKKFLFFLLSAQNYISISFVLSLLCIYNGAHNYSNERIFLYLLSIEHLFVVV